MLKPQVFIVFGAESPALCSFTCTALLDLTSVSDEEVKEDVSHSAGKALISTQ